VATPLTPDIIKV